MTATELAALIVAIASVAAVVLLAFALIAVNRTLRSVREAVELFHAQAIPMVTDLNDTVQLANAELERVDRVIGKAESISGTVDAGSRLAYRAFSGPVIKAMAAASGTSQAARGFRRRRSGR